MPAFYNEFERYPAQWLRNLSAANLIVPGVVDERSIKDLAPEDVRGATQAHFFAGVGIWSYALRLAGWPDELPVFTGSCPCQPWSQAGEGKGIEDERHLWPDWFKLIRACRPAVVFGEQVSGPNGLLWLDLVFSDLEAEGYTCEAMDLCSAGVGAPHIRQRLYWVAYSEEFRWSAGWNGRARGERDAAWFEFERHGDARLLVDAYRARFPWGGEAHDEHGRDASGNDAVRRGQDDGLVDSARIGRRQGSARELGDAAGSGCEGLTAARSTGSWNEGTAVERAGATRGFWTDADWLYCRDGKYRPTQSGIKPLVAGAPGRVGQIKAYGNGLTSLVAATFVRSFIEATQHRQVMRRAR